MVCFWVQIFGLALVYMIMNTTGSWLLYIDNPYSYGFPGGSRYGF